MQCEPKTRAFLAYLRDHAEVRKRISAPAGQTVVYSGDMTLPAWQSYERYRLRFPELNGRRLLPQILELIPAPPDSGFTDLRNWIESLNDLVPRRMNQIAAWQVVSGILCSNAVGDVTFIIGDNVEPQKKVFSATEVWALSANRNIAAESMELVAYCQQCFLTRKAPIPFAYIAA